MDLTLFIRAERVFTLDQKAAILVAMNTISVIIHSQVCRIFQRLAVVTSAEDTVGCLALEATAARHIQMCLLSQLSPELWGPKAPAACMGGVAPACSKASRCQEGVP